MTDERPEVLEGEIVRETVPAEDFNLPSSEPGVELEVRPQVGVTLFQTDDPQIVIQKATVVADALKSILVNRGLTKRIGAKDHVLVEGWQMCGTFVGVFAVKEWVRELPWPDPIPAGLLNQHEQGKVFGYVASFKAVRMDGSVVGGGEAECRRSEGKPWNTRDDFAVKSMAQTRATSKALKAPLGFIVALAGYSSTPAEEMPNDEPVPQGPPYGPAASAGSGESFGKAIGFISDLLAPQLSDRLSVQEIIQGITDNFGYMPQASAGAIVLLAKAIRDNHISAEEAATA